MKKFDIRKTSLFAESWNVAWRKKPLGSILNDNETKFNIIKNSWRYWAADPFVYEENGKVYIFAELYDYILCRGVIGVCEITGGKNTGWQPIIIGESHLSYPCFFCQQEKKYIMPESGAAHELALYGAVSFPYEWKKISVLKNNVNFADTTPIYVEKLAVTHDITDSKNPKLLLVDLCNDSIKLEAKMFSPLMSRPAGNVFHFQGVNYRPVQVSYDFNQGYGKELIFTKWKIDDQLGFSEEIVKQLKPEDLNYSDSIYLDGMHTYNSSENYEVIDIKTRRFNIVNFMFRILRKLERS